MIGFTGCKIRSDRGNGKPADRRCQKTLDGRRAYADRSDSDCRSAPVVKAVVAGIEKRNEP